MPMLLVFGWGLKAIGCVIAAYKFHHHRKTSDALRAAEYVLPLPPLSAIAAAMEGYFRQGMTVADGKDVHVDNGLRAQLGTLLMVQLGAKPDECWLELHRIQGALDWLFQNLWAPEKGEEFYRFAQALPGEARTVVESCNTTLLRASGMKPEEVLALRQEAVATKEEENLVKEVQDQAVLAEIWAAMQEMKEGVDC